MDDQQFYSELERYGMASRESYPKRLTDPWARNSVGSKQGYPTEGLTMSPGAAEALQQIENALQQAEERHDAATREVNALREARDAMRKSLGDTPLPALPTGRRQTVAEHHVEAVRKYLEMEGSARQSDIGKKLGINSGIVSVALKRLHERGEAVPGTKEYGSRIWSLAQAAPAPQRRERAAAKR